MSWPSPQPSAATAIVKPPRALDNATNPLLANSSMAARDKTKQAAGPAAVLLAADAKRKSIPIWLARNAGWLREAPLTGAQKAWGEAQGFKGSARKHLLLPGPEGTLAGAVLGLGEARAGDPMDKPELAVSHLPRVLAPGCYSRADRLVET